jgi:hypothetical protein
VHTVRILEENGENPPVSHVEFGAAAVVTLAELVLEEAVIGKLDGADCIRAVGVPEEEGFGKQDGAGYKRA